MFDECAERQLCLVVFLPHILDSTAAGRNGYIETLLNIAQRYKQRPFGYKHTRTHHSVDVEERV